MRQAASKYHWLGPSNEEPIVGVQAPGVMDVAVWRQKRSMTVHLVNLTNPMMMKGPFRELLPVSAEVRINIPDGKKVTGVHLLMSGVTPGFENKGGTLTPPDNCDTRS